MNETPDTPGDCVMAKTTKADLDAWTQKLAVLGIAQTATEEFLSAQLHFITFDQMKANIRASCYWPDFVSAVKAGAVLELEDRLPGALGRTVLHWAKEGV
jgi:hypothetical protein